MFLLWQETGVLKESFPVGPGVHIPSHMPMPGIEPIHFG